MSPRRAQPRESIRFHTRAAHPRPTPVRNNHREDTGDVPASNQRATPALSAARLEPFCVPRSAHGDEDCCTHHRSTIFKNLHVIDIRKATKTSVLFGPHIDDAGDVVVHHSGSVKSWRGEKTHHSADAALACCDQKDSYCHLLP